MPNTNIPNLQMSKVPNTVEKKLSQQQINTIRGTTSRQAIGSLVSSQAQVFKTGPNTPLTGVGGQSSNKKSKRNHIEVRRQSKHGPSSTISNSSPEQRLISLEARERMKSPGEPLPMQLDNGEEHLIHKGSSKMKIKKDELGGNQRINASSPYNGMHYPKRGSAQGYQSETHFVKHKPEENSFQMGSQSPHQLITPLKSMVTANQMANIKNRASQKKKPSVQMSSSHAVPSNPTQQFVSSPVKQDLKQSSNAIMMPKASAKSIRPSINQAIGPSANKQTGSMISAGRHSVTSGGKRAGDDHNQAKSSSPTIQLLPTQKTKKLQQQFHSKTNSVGISDQRPSTATQSYAFKDRNAVHSQYQMINNPSMVSAQTHMTKPPKRLSDQMQMPKQSD